MVLSVPKLLQEALPVLEQYGGNSLDTALQITEDTCAVVKFVEDDGDEYHSSVDYAEFLAHLPLLRSANNDKLLEERGVQQIRHTSSYYYFRVTDLLKAGEPMALFMARDKIVRILTNRRQGEVIRTNEERIRQNADNNGIIRIYRDSLNIN